MKNIIKYGLFISFLFILSSCVSYADYKTVKERYDHELKAKGKAKERILDLEKMLSAKGKPVDDEVVKTLRSEIANLKKQLMKKDSKPDGKRERALAEKIKKTIGNARINGNEVSTTLSEGILQFQTGKISISSSGKRVLTELASTLRHIQGVIVIEGHTDDTPMRNKQNKAKYVDNLGLGAARAAEVFRFLVLKGVNPLKMLVASFGPYRPKVSGTSKKARQTNRRVEIKIRLDK